MDHLQGEAVTDVCFVPQTSPGEEEARHSLYQKILYIDLLVKNMTFRSNIPSSDRIKPSVGPKCHVSASVKRRKIAMMEDCEARNRVTLMCTFSVSS